MSHLEIKKGLLGGYTFCYECPHCATHLKSAIDEAGTSQSCPDCGHGFTVPGSEERKRIQREMEHQAVARLQEKQRAEKLKRDRQLKLEAERKRIAEENRQRRIAAEHFEEELIASNTSEVSRCPFCAEEILACARKCKYCGEYLQLQDAATASTRDYNSQTESKRKRSNVVPYTFIAFCGLFVLGIISAAFDPDNRANRSNSPTRLDNPHSLNQRSADLLIAGIAFLGGNTAIETVSVSGNTATITVSNAWHLSPYQIRLQAAQNLQKLWFKIAPTESADEARISIVDLNGNEVSGSRVLGGSLIWVQEN